MTPLETRIADALAADVARFESMDTGYRTQQVDSLHADNDLLPIRLAAGRPRRRRRTMVAVAAVALACLAAVAIALRRNDGSSGSDSGPLSIESVPTPTGPIVVPAGIEQPLVETAITPGHDLAKPGSVHAFSVEGHPPVEVLTTLSPNSVTGAVEEWLCVGEAGSGGCGPVSIPAQFGQTSSVDNGVAPDDLFTWSNLPPEVRSVGYDDGAGVQLWQRPVAGLVIFRVDPNHPHPTLTAYDATGTALPYSFWEPNAPLTPVSATTADTPTGEPATQAATGEIWGELADLTQSSLRDCLTSNGATFTLTNVPTFAAGVDPLAIWNTCTVEVTSIVAARQAELNKGK